jgi:hypothetical protein
VNHPLDGELWLPGPMSYTFKGGMFDLDDPDIRLRAIVVTPTNRSERGKSPYEYGEQISRIVDWISNNTRLDTTPIVYPYTPINKHTSEDTMTPQGKILLQYGRSYTRNCGYSKYKTDGCFPKTLTSAPARKKVPCSPVSISGLWINTVTSKHQYMVIPGIQMSASRSTVWSIRAQQACCSTTIWKIRMKNIGIGRWDEQFDGWTIT